MSPITGPTCAHCGREFVPMRYAQRFCSMEECQRARRRAAQLEWRRRKASETHGTDSSPNTHNHGNPSLD